jgi:hypothetical protein
MKSNLRLLLIAAALGLVAVFGWSVRGQQRASPRLVWEHKIVPSYLGDNQDELTRLGAQGWELVSVRTEDKFTGNFKQTEVTYYLKRAK